MEAASAAALRGHLVTLYEECNHLGGQFYTASLPPSKQEIAQYLRYMDNQMRRAGVEVVLGEHLTAEKAIEGKPDVLVVSTGGRPMIPDMPGVDQQNVVKAPDVLMGKVIVGQRVLVAGGGLVGCETALFLFEQGKEVTIVEMLPELAGDLLVVPREALMRRLGDSRITVLSCATIVEFTKNGVIIERGGRREAVEDMDTVVLALGVISVNDLADSAAKTITEVHIVGDAQQPGKAMEAITAGAMIGRQI